MKDFLKSWGLLLAALLVGALAFFAATRYLSDAEENIKRSLAGSGGEMVDIVVANMDLPAGTTVSAENLAVAQVSAMNLSAAVITPDVFEEVDGSLLKFPMSSGEPLLSHFLEGVLIERFSELLENGERAVTLEVDDLSSNAGLLSVGDRVDIFLSGAFAESEDGDEEVLVPLFQNIKVLSVDRNPLLTKEREFRAQNYLNDEDVFDYSSVTLALKADDADNLAFAASRGEIVFLLRSTEDNQMRNWSVVDTASVIESNSSVPKRNYTFFGRSNRDAGGIKPEKRAVLNLIQTAKPGRKLVKSVPIQRAESTKEIDVAAIDVDVTDPAIADEGTVEQAAEPVEAQVETEMQADEGVSDTEQEPTQEDNASTNNDE